MSRPSDPTQQPPLSRRARRREAQRQLEAESARDSATVTTASTATRVTVAPHSTGPLTTSTTTPNVTVSSSPLLAQSLIQTSQRSVNQAEKPRQVTTATTTTEPQSTSSITMPTAAPKTTPTPAPPQQQSTQVSQQQSLQKQAAPQPPSQPVSFPNSSRSLATPASYQEYNLIAYDPGASEDALSLEQLAARRALEVRRTDPRGKSFEVNSGCVLLVSEDGTVIQEAARLSQGKKEHAEIVALMEIIKSKTQKEPLDGEENVEFILNNIDVFRNHKVVIFTERAPCEIEKHKSGERTQSCDELFRELKDRGIDISVYYVIPRAVSKEGKRSPDNESVTLGMLLPTAMDAFNGSSPPLKVTEFIKAQITSRMGNEVTSIQFYEDLLSEPNLEIKHKIWFKGRGVPIDTVLERIRRNSWVLNLGSQNFQELYALSSSSRIAETAGPATLGIPKTNVQKGTATIDEKEASQQAQLITTRATAGATTTGTMTTTGPATGNTTTVMRAAVAPVMPEQPPPTASASSPPTVENLIEAIQATKKFMEEPEVLAQLALIKKLAKGLNIQEINEDIGKAMEEITNKYRSRRVKAIIVTAIEENKSNPTSGSRLSSIQAAVAPVILKQPIEKKEASQQVPFVTTKEKAPIGPKYSFQRHQEILLALNNLKDRQDRWKMRLLKDKSSSEGVKLLAELNQQLKEQKNIDVSYYPKLQELVAVLYIQQELINEAQKALLVREEASIHFLSVIPLPNTVGSTLEMGPLVPISPKHSLATARNVSNPLPPPTTSANIPDSSSPATVENLIKAIRATKVFMPEQAMQAQLAVIKSLATNLNIQKIEQQRIEGEIEKITNRHTWNRVSSIIKTAIRENKNNPTRGSHPHV